MVQELEHWFSSKAVIFIVQDVKTHLLGILQKELNILAKIIKDGTFNGKITLTGGEPLMQKEALMELLKELKGLDVIVYTGHQKEDVPNEVWKLTSYVKCGPFIERLKTTIKPYVGSSNQELIKSEGK